MEGKKQGCSPSSITADLFGAKESQPPSSTGTFASIFPPPSTLVGKNSSSTEVIGSWQKQHSENQTQNMKQGTPAIGSGGARCSIPNKERSSIFQEERVEPCHLSSSLYYGGQDIYSQSPSTQSSGSYPLFNQNGGEDDPNGNNSNSVSRGNWWQGPCPPRHKSSPSVLKEFMEPRHEVWQIICNINKYPNKKKLM